MDHGKKERSSAKKNAKAENAIRTGPENSVKSVYAALEKSALRVRLVADDGTQTSELASKTRRRNE